jgi:pimeloyl-ACP methyl ester carboxylesterase
MLNLTLRQVVMGIAALLCVALLAYFAIGAYMGIALTQPKREAPPPAIEAAATSQAVTVTARDGVRLAGWFYPKRNSERAIIFAHGLNGCSLCSFEGKFDIFQTQLNEAGYNLLAIDLRGHGQSGGAHVTFGEEERWDVLGAVDWLRQQGFTQIAVLGTSLGAVSTVRADLEPDGAQSIKAMVLDSCFTDFSDVLDRNFTDATGYPTFLLPGALLMTRLLLHVDLAGVKPVEELPHTKTPLLIIYGDHDRYVTLAQEQAMAAARPDAGFWLVAGPEHSRIYDRYPAEYMARVTQFLDQTLQ